MWLKILIFCELQRKVIFPLFRTCLFYTFCEFWILMIKQFSFDGDFEGRALGWFIIRKRWYKRQGDLWGRLQWLWWGRGPAWASILACLTSGATRIFGITTRLTGGKFNFMECANPNFLRTNPPLLGFLRLEVVDVQIEKPSWRLQHSAADSKADKKGWWWQYIRGDLQRRRALPSLELQQQQGARGPRKHKPPPVRLSTPL